MDHDKNTIHEPESNESNETSCDGRQAATTMIETVLELELPVSVALGHADLVLKDVLKMRLGSVIELEKEASEEVELLAHGTLVARGEMMLVKDNYAFRVKELVTHGVEPLLLGSGE